MVKKYRAFFTRKLVCRVIGGSMVALITSIILIHNLANIGGSFTIANAGPKVLIDATTISAMQLPIKYEYESRGFSWFHNGVDLVAPQGTPVKPIAAGIVKTVNYDYFGFGKHVIIAHNEGYESIYGHLSKIEVKAGEKVSPETKIGEVGSTGFSTGSHLHLEIHQNGAILNPADIVPGVK